MYRITMDNAVFFDPRLDGYPLGAPKLLREANKIGTFTFTIYPPHPAYGHISTRKTLFTIYKDSKPVYIGRPIYNKRTFKTGIEYKCEEITGIMNDYMFRPEAFSGNVYDLFMRVLSSINNRSREIGFMPGNIMNPGTVEWGTDKAYMGHWDALQELVKQFGGYVFPRYEEGKVYIDWMREEDLPEASQKIVFGENMKDMFIETDAIESYSGLIPLGAAPAGGTGKINIKSVNGGLDVIYNADAVSLYGERETVKEWKDITTPQELLNVAYEWIRSNAVQFRKTVKLNAVDLHNLDMSIESLPFMHRVTAESRRHDLFAKYILSREEVPLDKPTGMQLTLGDTRRTFTESVNIGG